MTPSGSDRTNTTRATLVLTLVVLLRQLMERQALRRVERGSHTDDQIEEVGSTLMALEARMAELRDHFGLAVEDLNLDLGPLARFCLAKDAQPRCLPTTVGQNAPRCAFWGWDDPIGLTMMEQRLRFFAPGNIAAELQAADVPVPIAAADAAWRALAGRSPLLSGLARLLHDWPELSPGRWPPHRVPSCTATGRWEPRRASRRADHPAGLDIARFWPALLGPVLGTWPSPGPVGFLTSTSCPRRDRSRVRKAVFQGQQVDNAALAHAAHGLAARLLAGGFKVQRAART